jgi:mRNA interferase MazF
VAEIEAGDVLTVSFPGHAPPGHEQHGTRPAIVVGLPKRLGIPRFDILIVVPMSRYRGQAWADASRELYPRFETGIARLRSPSIALLDQVRAVDLERVINRRGELSEEQYARLRDGLERMIERRK